jgi:YYY domain-containing protein
MLNVLLWVGAVEVVGLAVFPLCYFLFPGLKDRGYSVSKPFGILLIAYLSWMLSVLQLVPAVQLTVAGLLAAVAGLSGWYGWRRRREILEFVVRERFVLLATEGVFLAMFLVWVVYRAYDPFISNTEQPMDFAFLNASVRSFLGTPEDPWLRGESVSYYYFGYWMMGALTKLTGVPTSISYNLSLALIPAMGAMGMFGLVVNMIRSDARRLRWALGAGAAAAVLLVVVANLEGVLEFMRANGMGSQGFWDWIRVGGLDGGFAGPAESWRPLEFNWWWRASRVVSTFQGDQVLDYTIHEFPFFSFILGDLHPHVMSIPFVVLFLSICWNYLRTPIFVWPFDRQKLGEWAVPLAAVLSTGLVLGGMAFTNMWDPPVYFALLVGVAAIKAYSARGVRLTELINGTALFLGAVLAVAIVLILPYLLSFTSQVSGISPVDNDKILTTRLPHMFIVWGLFLVAVMPFIFTAFWRTTVDEDWGGTTVISLLIGFSPYVIWAFLYLEDGGTTTELMARLFHVLPFALVISVAAYSAIWHARQDVSPKGQVFALVLAALGLLLIMGPELLFVDDAFGGANERMNTVFKLYYQAWVVLAAATGYAIYHWGSLREGITGARFLFAQLWAIVFIVLLFGAAYYPLTAAATKGNLFGGEATLDGLSFLNRFNEPAVYSAIEFIQNDADRDSALLEAVGDDYTPFGRISSSTGVPTVLGWAGHELQWRGSSEPMQGRREDVALIYTTTYADVAKNLLAKYRVDYVYVGARERETYGEEGLGKFAEFMDTVFDVGGVKVYRMARQVPGLD